MLSDQNIENINEQIAGELRDLGSIFTTDENKPAIMERIVALKSLLTTQPDPDDIMDMMAAKLAGYINNPDALAALLEEAFGPRP